MAESTIRWFVEREKHCSLAKNVRLIRQANRVWLSGEVIYKHSHIYMHDSQAWPCILCIHTCISSWHARYSTLYHLQTLFFFLRLQALSYILSTWHVLLGLSPSTTGLLNWVELLRTSQSSPDQNRGSSFSSPHLRTEAWHLLRTHPFLPTPLAHASGRWFASSREYQ
jgi:hypothetical protein